MHSIGVAEIERVQTPLAVVNQISLLYLVALINVKKQQTTELYPGDFTVVMIDGDMSIRFKCFSISCS